jgi:hypothetical protein
MVPAGVNAMRSIWVIYRNPTDFPAIPYVMREHVLENGSVIPTSHFESGNTLGEVRMFIPDDAVRMPRSQGDEPQIVEWWV